jgi:hypothetical protein
VNDIIKRTGTKAFFCKDRVSQTIGLWSCITSVGRKKRKVFITSFNDLFKRRQKGYVKIKLKKSIKNG